MHIHNLYVFLLRTTKKLKKGVPMGYTEYHKWRYNRLRKQVAVGVPLIIVFTYFLTRLVVGS